MTYVQMTGLTWPEAEALGAADALGLIPTGAVEQHGPHLPLGTDCFIAEALAHRIAGALEEPVVVAPIVPGGLSTHHLAFPGTVTLTEAAFEGALDAYVAAFERMGIRRVAIFSGHGGNLGFLGRYETAYAERVTDVRLIAHHDFEGYVEAMFAGARDAGLEPVATDVHAGGVETSQGLALFGDLVRDFGDVEGYTAGEDDWRERMLADGIDAVSPSGVLGDVRDATAVAGEAILARIAAYLVDWIADSLSSSIGAYSKS